MQGFSATRSLTYPFLVHRLHPSIWLMADAPREKGNARNSEVVAYGVEPEEVLATLREAGVAKHFVCALCDDAEEAEARKQEYKERGYRLLHREPLFVLPVSERKRYEEYPIRRVTNEADAEAVAKAALSRQLLPEHLTEDDAHIRLYAAFEEETSIGWVSSVRTHSDCAWVASLFVNEAFRGRGIGRSLMSKMLDEDARYSVENSILLASSAGSRLYPHLGYEQRGLLLVLAPRKLPAGEAS